MKHLLHKALGLKVLMLVTLLMSAVGSAWAESVTYTISSKNTLSTTGTAPEGSNAEIVETYNTSKQMTSGNSQTLTITGFNGYKVTNITLSMKSNQSRGSGSLSYSVDGGDSYTTIVDNEAFNTSSWYGSWSTSYVNVSKDVEIEPTSSGFIIKISASANSLYCQSYTLTYEAASAPGDQSVATTTTIDDSGITNTDLYDGTEAGSLSAIVMAGEDAVDGATVTWSGNNDEVATIDAETGAVTLVAVGTVTFTATYAGVEDEYKASSDTYELTVTDSTPIPTHIATFSVNGETSTQEFEEGADIEFPTEIADVSGKSFVGWVAEAISGITDIAPSFVTSATMDNSDITYYAVFADVQEGTETNIEDELDRAFTGSTGSSYANWSNKTGTSGAVYAGNSAGGNNSIQLRTTNNNSGIVTTTSGGSVTKIEVEWNSSTANGRTIDVYGANSAYTDASDLYNINKQGNKIGSIVYGTSTSITITKNDYKYIGFRSNSSALYLDQVTITWAAGTPATMSGYCTNVSADTREEAGISFAEAEVTKELVAGYTGQALANPNELEVTYTSSDESVATVDEDGILTVLAVGETTITATFAGDENYKVGNASYVLTIQDTRASIEPEFAAESVRVLLGKTVAAPTLNGNEGNGTVTYASSDETIATVDPSTGEVTGVADGEATITATIAASQTHQGGEATFTVTVIDQYKKGSANLPYTVEEAIAAIDAGVGVTGVYARGVVSEIVTAFNSTYGNISYNITDESGEVLQSYRGFSYDGEKFESETDIQVGDAVLIYGNLKLYKTTYEFDQNNQLVARVASTTESVSATIPTSGYATFSSVASLDFSATTSNNSDFKAWFITNIEGDVVILEQVTGAIAGCQGVILYGNPGTYDIPTTASANNLEGNKLIGTYVPTTIGDNEAYGLKNGQFQMINAGTMPAGKAYLPVSAVPSSNEVKALTLVFNDATGIQRTEIIPATDVVYSLQGVRIQNPLKGGVYIVNGKKVVIK